MSSARFPELFGRADKLAAAAVRSRELAVEVETAFRELEIAKLRAEEACAKMRAERDGLRVLAVGAEKAREETKQEIISKLRRRSENPNGNAETLEHFHERKAALLFANLLEAGKL